MPLTLSARWRGWWATRSLSFLAYRYRYLCVFTIFGFLSILLEIAIAQRLAAFGWGWRSAAGVAFVAGLLTSFGLNASFNFNVTRRHLLATFVRFTAVSVLSFALNMLAVAAFRHQFQQGYGMSRLLCSGVLFLLAYWVHRRFPFD